MSTPDPKPTPAPEATRGKTRPRPQRTSGCARTANSVVLAMVYLAVVFVAVAVHEEVLTPRDTPVGFFGSEPVVLVSLRVEYLVANYFWSQEQLHGTTMFDNFADATAHVPLIYAQAITNLLVARDPCVSSFPPTLVQTIHQALNPGVDWCPVELVEADEPEETVGADSDPFWDPLHYTGGEPRVVGSIAEFHRLRDEYGRQGFGVCTMFHASYCGHCRKAIPEWEAFAADPGSRVRVLMLETSESVERADLFEMIKQTSVPQFMCEPAWAVRASEGWDTYPPTANLSGSPAIDLAGAYLDHCRFHEGARNAESFRELAADSVREFSVRADFSHPSIVLWIIDRANDGMLHWAQQVALEMGTVIPEKTLYDWAALYTSTLEQPYAWFWRRGTPEQRHEAADRLFYALVVHIPAGTPRVIPVSDAAIEMAVVSPVPVMWLSNVTEFCKSVLCWPARGDFLIYAHTIYCPLPECEGPFRTLQIDTQTTPPLVALSVVRDSGVTTIHHPPKPWSEMDTVDALEWAAAVDSGEAPAVSRSQLPHTPEEAAEYAPLFRVVGDTVGEYVDTDAAADATVYILFTRESCGFCRTFMPTVRRVATECETGAIEIGVYDLDFNAPPTLLDLDLRSVPTLVAFRPGKEPAVYRGARVTADVCRWVGLTRPEVTAN